jgi:hypothetical protein
MQSTQIFSRAETPGFLRGTTVNSDAAAPVLRSEMAIVESETKLHRGTNWWGAFVIGLSGPILVTGIDPPAVESLGAAAIPLLAIACFAGVILCFVWPSWPR